MRPEEVKRLLEEVQNGRLSPDDALLQLRQLPVSDLGFAQLDLHRELRQGLPEAIYSESKTPEQVVSIAAQLLDHTTAPILATRASPEVAEALHRKWETAEYHPTARMVVLRAEENKLPGRMAIVSAGTSDLPVAEEARVTAEALGASVETVTDVGVAGLHRLLNVQDKFQDANVVVVVAGMEGALASLVGGITAAPVVAVPTSVGYGSSFDGLAALLAMLNSCAAGVVVTNIDNGFGAATFALRLLRRNLA